jgi:hypothetical protein
MPNENIEGTSEQRRREAARKLEILRARIKDGVDALDRGDFVEVDAADLENFLHTAV